MCPEWQKPTFYSSCGKYYYPVSQNLNLGLLNKERNDEFLNNQNEGYSETKQILKEIKLLSKIYIFLINDEHVLEEGIIEPSRDLVTPRKLFLR